MSFSMLKKRSWPSSTAWARASSLIFEASIAGAAAAAAAGFASEAAAAAADFFAACARICAAAMAVGAATPGAVLRAAAGAEAEADDCARAASCNLPACVAKVSRAYIVAEHTYT
jgi:hypothetical protein